METIKILGIDPSLRNTGLALIHFNTEKPPEDPSAYKVTHCQCLSNPAKYTGTDAILNMLDMLTDESEKDCYIQIDNVIIESPAIMYNKTWSGGAISSIAHISGGCIPIFGIQKAHIFRPNEWNKTRKKEITHSNTMAFLGHVDNWHFEKRVKSEKFLEHVLDAASLALWWIRSNYVESEEEEEGS